MTLPLSLVLIAKSSLGIEKLKNCQQSLMMLLLDNFKTFVRNKVAAKFNDFK